MTQQWPVSLYAAEEEDQMAKCACAAPPPTAHPHQNKTLAKKKEKKKATANTSTPPSMDTKSRKRQEGPQTKVQRDLGPLSSFVLKNGEVQEQLLLAAWDI